MVKKFNTGQAIIIVRASKKIVAARYKPELGSLIPSPKIFRNINIINTYTKRDLIPTFIVKN